ncbi:MAG: L,D-transpeptidase family protein [Bacteriovoracaceae bacterium]|nr:L,D-transpeptidase family protein [Bacteriovoracaceae bacterium]
MNKMRFKSLFLNIFYCLAVLLSINSFASQAQVKHYPSPLIYLDAALTHHVLIAEKSTHKLHLFENNDSYPKLVKSYDMATGKKAGNKIFEGDHRTPEGIYFLNSFITNDELLSRYGDVGKIYGVGAFVLDYPNPIDRNNKKSGGGIWLHSTNDETRIDKGLDSRGCFVVKNNDLKEISTYIEISKTQLVSVHELNYLKEDNWLSNRIEIKNVISGWLDSWKMEDIDSYISYYHPKEFISRKGALSSYKRYKRAVFSSPGAPLIEITNLSILKTKGYAVATFIQKYQSKTIMDTGLKTIYLKKDNYYNWKIISENWRKVQNPENYLSQFSPSMRFFAPNQTITQ